MKKWLVVVALMCGVVGLGQDAFAKAEQAYQNADYNQAQTAFEKLYYENRDDLRVVERLGDIAGQRKQYETAMGYYKTLVERDGNNANYNFKYGATMGLFAKNSSRMKAVGMLDDIKLYLKKAARLDRNHIEVRHALSQFYCELPGIVGGSIKTAREYAVQLQSVSKVDYYLALGYIEEYEKNWYAAEAAYKNAIKTGGSALTYTKLAVLYEKHMKRAKEALNLYEKAFKIHKDENSKLEIARIKSAYGL